MNATRPGWARHQRCSADVHSADPAEVADLLTALDGGAVDVTEDDRRDLARRHAGHRLVEERQPVGDSTRVDREPALGAQAEGQQVRVTVLPARCGRVRRRRGRGRQVAGGQMAVHVQHRDVPAFDRVVGQVVEEPFGARGPAVGQRRLTAGAEDHREVEAAAHRPRRVARLAGAARRPAAGSRPRRLDARAGTPPPRRRAGRRRSSRSGSTSDQMSRAADQSPCS